jgi:opacity protein-like surface antigen
MYSQTICLANRECECAMTRHVRCRTVRGLQHSNVQEGVMRKFMIAVTVMIGVAAPTFAQDRPEEAARGYVSGVGGFATSVGNTTGDVGLEVGVRIAPHVMAFGNIGRFTDLQGELQPTLSNATTSLLANQDLGVTGGGTLPASFYQGGLRLEIPTGTKFLPYTLGAVGVAHLSPTPQFLFASGIMPDGSTPSVGTDVTSALVSAGALTTPGPSNAFMFTLGGGVQYPLIPHWVVDVGYRYSRISADQTLSATPINANGMTFGFGYRF